VVFFKNVDFPRPADSVTSARDQGIFIFQKLTVSLFLHPKSDNHCSTQFRMLLDILVHLKGILRPLRGPPHLSRHLGQQLQTQVPREAR